MFNFDALSNFFELHTFRSERAEFYGDLAEMFESGQNLRKFIEMQVDITRRTGQTSFNKAYRTMLRRFDGGESDNTLPFMLDTIVPESDMPALVAIEEGGAMRKHIGLRELADSISREKELKTLVLTALALPAVMIPFIGYLAFILADVVISVDKSSPDFLKDEVFSGFNDLVRTLSIYTKSYGAYGLGVIGVLAVIFAILLPAWTGSMRLKIDNWPGFALYRDFQSAKVFSALAMLLESGKKLIPSLELVGSRGGGWTRWQVRRILGYLEETPTGYIPAFSMGICSPYVEGRLTVLNNILMEREARGDNKQDFADVIVTVGKKEVSKTMVRIRRSSAILNTVLLFGLFSYASILGLGSMTVPGKFAEMMEPNTMANLKLRFEAKKKAAAAYSSQP